MLSIFKAVGQTQTELYSFKVEKWDALYDPFLQTRSQIYNFNYIAYHMYEIATL